MVVRRHADDLRYVQRSAQRSSRCIVPGTVRTDPSAAAFCTTGTESDAVAGRGVARPREWRPGADAGQRSAAEPGRYNRL